MLAEKPQVAETATKREIYGVEELKRGASSYTNICSTWNHPNLIPHMKAHAEKRKRASSAEYLKSFVTQFYEGSRKKFEEGLAHPDRDQFFADNLIPYYKLEEDFTTRMADKRRFSRDLIERYFPIAPGGKVLEIGSAFGITTYQLLARGYRVTSLEPSKFASGVAVKALTQIGVMSGDNLKILNEGIPAALTGLEPGSFDAVLASNVFEHVPDPAYLASLRPFYDILKPGGLLCIVAPDGNQDLQNLIKNPAYGKSLASATHFAVKSLAYYTTTCAAAGFTIKAALFAGKPSYPRCVVSAEKPARAVEAVPLQPSSW
ncbi:bifunctional 2-polyprenyl-6-hydroxyphenol methylase/3-demethylubiquinol 3-O-methyltransferase UbiG [Methylosinus sp. Sm6]|uniref:class I SAM-dependent methyltransferase n=1 Tax=Methylosinus sp. Sm6 TaxID=2866948 RepID=UPI001C999E73|nr:class I SAM-dependent methyltransferase [Methylosinus sp. Sm6]MBY6242072.1 class I SAM-dependent methyltransferase [Methylosinus sp. Sm6]